MRTEQEIRDRIAKITELKETMPEEIAVLTPSYKRELNTIISELKWCLNE